MLGKRRVGGVARRGPARLAPGLASAQLPNHPLALLQAEGVSEFPGEVLPGRVSFRLLSSPKMEMGSKAAIPLALRMEENHKPRKMERQRNRFSPKSPEVTVL